MLRLIIGRPPRGGRGLKSLVTRTAYKGGVSPPSRGAWIEIHETVMYHVQVGSPPSRGAWIEITLIDPRLPV